MFRNEELYGSYRGKVRGIKTYIHRHTQRPQAHEHTHTPPKCRGNIRSD